MVLLGGVGAILNLILSGKVINLVRDVCNIFVCEGWNENNSRTVSTTTQEL